MRLNLARTLPRSAANGPGERFVVWVQGCPLHCPGCWNPDTWAFQRRDLRSVDELAADILGTEGIEGVTFSGGEPFAQARALAALAERVRAAGLSVFVFTGYELDELTRPEHHTLLAVTDVLVTGRYVQARRASDLPWRGSANQRVHFLTDRYGPADMVGAPRVELHLAPDGGLTLTGFPTDERLLPSPPVHAPSATAAGASMALVGCSAVPRAGPSLTTESRSVVAVDAGPAYASRSYRPRK